MTGSALFNPFDPAYQADPYPTFHRMRSTEPRESDRRVRARVLSSSLPGPTLETMSEDAWTPEQMTARHEEGGGHE